MVSALPQSNTSNGLDSRYSVKGPMTLNCVYSSCIFPTPQRSLDHIGVLKPRALYARASSLKVCYDADMRGRGNQFIDPISAKRI